MASDQSLARLKEQLPTVVKEEQPEEQLEFGLQSTVVKEEPPEELPEIEAEYTSFCYETVTKEEVILEDEVHVKDEPVSDHESDPKISNSNRTDKEISTGATVKCSECDRTFKKVFELNRHIKWHNSIKLGLNRCSYCNKTFSYKGSLMRHIESHKKIWESSGASGSNLDDPALEIELPLTVRRGRPKSTKVSAESDHEVTIEVILEEGVEERHEPELDNETSNEPLEPIAELTEDGAIKCTECGRTFQTYGLLKRHIRWHKAIKLGLYRCKYCSKEFSFKASLLRHIESHKRIWDASKTGGSSESKQDEPVEGSAAPVRRGKPKQHFSPVNCPICGKEFKRQGKFNTHMAHHEAIKQGSFTCDLCSKRFPTSTTLHYHRLIHAKGEDRFTCHVCHEKFPCRATLNKHQIIHKTDSLSIKFAQQVVQKEDGVFNCTVCGKNFPNRVKALSHFRSHVQLSTGDSEPELFICDICDRRWKRKSQIRRHMEIHKSGRFRTCLICQMKFETNAAFLSHRVVHKTDALSIRLREVMVQDEQGAFTCTICDQHFDNRAKARIHLRKQH